MREIKFRAWDEGDKKMINDICYLELLGTNRNVSGMIINFDIEDERVDENSTYIDANCFELMQYTGLKGKNGVEIYEGDIVEITHPFRQRYHLGEVFYDGYQFNVKGFWFPHYDLPNDAFSEGTIYIEVIGNIYENPDLLEREGE